MNKIEIIPISFSFLRNDNISKDKIYDKLEKLRNELNSSKFYLIEPKGIKLDLRHAVASLTYINSNNLAMPFMAIQFDVLGKGEDINEECLFTYNPDYGNPKLNLFGIGLAIKGDVLRNALMVLTSMNTFSWVTLAMLTPIIYKLIMDWGSGIMLYPVDKVDLKRIEIPNDTKTLLKSYMESVLGDKTEKFIEEFSYDIE